MIISIITGKCPKCNSEVEVPFEDLDLYLKGSEVVISFECPECESYIVNEKLEEQGS